MPVEQQYFSQTIKAELKHNWLITEKAATWSQLRTQTKKEYHPNI